LAHAFGSAEATRLIKSTGVQSRRLAGHLCTSDFCVGAAEHLLAALRWDRDSIRHLVFVSQTPDYILPATACTIHQRLGLSRECAAFDINLGCSGYVYGLWVLGKLLGPGERGLLLVGDTSSRVAHPKDRSTAPLFGDAGSATALEYSAGAAPIHFKLGTDGAGCHHIAIPTGGFRTPWTSTAAQPTEREKGNIRSDMNLQMNGAEVFAFSLREVPALVDAGLKAAGWTRASCDAFVFHQANRFILDHLRDKAELDPAKVPVGLGQFGNTSSASIPLALTTELGATLSRSTQRCLLIGFGVGWSWGVAAVQLGPMVIPQLIELDDLAET
jgi:3-oxoacyl-[acyl-carrier-protein] synthase-3